MKAQYHEKEEKTRIKTKVKNERKKRWVGHLMVSGKRSRGIFVQVKKK